MFCPLHGAGSKAYTRLNKEKYNKWNKTYREANPEKEKFRRKKWYDENRRVPKKKKLAIEENRRRKRIYDFTRYHREHANARFNKTEKFSVPIPKIEVPFKAGKEKC